MFKKIMRVVLSKTFAFALLALLQIGIFFALAFWLSSVGAVAYTVITVLTALVLVAVLEQDELNAAYKLMWVLIIILMPVTGTLFYLLWGHRHVPRRKKKLFVKVERRANEAMEQDAETLLALHEMDHNLYHSALYLLRNNYSPVYAGNETEYYPVGEAFFPRFIEEIKKAEKFIFMEYYIYEEGYMLDTTVELLAQKAAEGVDVRVLADGFGSLFTLPPGYDKMLQERGIQCRFFSPLELTLHVSDYAMLNHRDHRKIAVIDGRVAFSGGLNFADEYINHIERFGQWKDTAFLIRGPAAYSLTVTFLRGWDYVVGMPSDFSAYRPLALPAPPEKQDGGYVQPYWDSPLDAENVSENAYLNIIHRAVDYVYISTPYLILDQEMITSLTLAAKSGVDVRILTPGIPDKRLVFLLTQSYYPALLRGGVRIFEYTPGFNHAKMYVSDDKVAIVGSANMDYRSLYLHFENCVSFYGGGVVRDAKQDMIESLGKSREILLEDTRKISLWRRLLQIVVRFFAPMM